MVFPLFGKNLYETLTKGQLPQCTMRAKAKLYTAQILAALSFMHAKGKFHRDIKPENILVSPDSNHVVIADLGSCRSIFLKYSRETRSERDDYIKYPISLYPKRRISYTEYISTRWYRAPECMLTDGSYGPEMDVWAVGCVLYELVTALPLFPGKDEYNQLKRIHDFCGRPPRKLCQILGWKDPHLLVDHRRPIANPVREMKVQLMARLIQDGYIEPEMPQLVDLLGKMLHYDPRYRLTAEKALEHPFFHSVRSLIPGSSQGHFILPNQWYPTRLLTPLFKRIDKDIDVKVNKEVCSDPHIRFPKRAHLPPPLPVGLGELHQPKRGFCHRFKLIFNPPLSNTHVFVPLTENKLLGQI